MNHETPFCRMTPAPGPLRIGPLVIDPPLLQAPMAGFTNYAYPADRSAVRRRRAVRPPRCSAPAGFVEMNARHEGTPDRLWGVRGRAAAAGRANLGQRPGHAGRSGAGGWRTNSASSVVDINFGCPVRDVSEKAESGSYLLRDPGSHRARSSPGGRGLRPDAGDGQDPAGPARRSTINAIDVAQAVEGAGGAAVTVHGRTAGRPVSRPADWDQIARIKPHLQRIPLIGNGDLKTPEAVVEAFARYGVDGVMIGRAALTRPWLFRQVGRRRWPASRSRPSRPWTEQRRLLLEHYRLDRRTFRRARRARFSCARSPAATSRASRGEGSSAPGCPAPRASTSSSRRSRSVFRGGLENERTAA